MLTCDSCSNSITYGDELVETIQSYQHCSNTEDYEYRLTPNVESEYHKIL